MATTQNGIYYPDDYTEVADIPADMEDMAESIDTALDTKVDKEAGKGLSTYNFGVVSKGRLDSLWENKDIIATKIAQDRATYPRTEGEGENITLDKTAEMEFIEPPLPKGNSTQNGIPASNNEVAINNVTGDVEVVLGNKNLIVMEAGDISSTTGNETTSSTAARSTALVPLAQGQTIVCSGYLNGLPGLRLYDKNGDYLSYKSFSSSTKAFTNNVENAAYFRVRTTLGGYTVEQYNKSLMIEYGSTATSFKQHTERTYNFPLGTDKLMLGDYLADDGIHHVRKQITASGTSIILSDAKNNGAYICSQKEAGNLTGQTLTFDTTVTDVVIEYELATEVVIPYTTEQQEVYNTIKEVLAYEEVTNINGSSNGTKPIFSVVAYQNMRLVLASLS